MGKEKQNLYNPVIDILRTISIFAVILVHTTTRTLEVTKYNLLKTPWTLFLNQAARFAVPLFFMISGFVLELNYHLHESYLTYLKKRFSRIFVPYVFWSIIYYFFVYYKNRDPNFLRSLIFGDASYQLYFIPSLLIFYLLFPFLHKYFKLVGNKWMMIALGLFQLFFLYFDYNIKALPFYYPLNIALLNYFVFILGMSLARNQKIFLNFIKQWKMVLFVGTVLFACLVFFEGLTGYLATKNYGLFYSSWRPSILVYTLFFAGFMYWVFDRKLKFISIIKIFAKLSFFVFFIHVIILEALWYLIGVKIFQLRLAQQVWYDPLYFLAVTGISFSIAYLVHKIPYLSKLTG